MQRKMRSEEVAILSSLRFLDVELNVRPVCV
jgi:hypothetical protein